MFDIGITGGLVLDGTGKTPTQIDIGIKDGIIVETAKSLSTEARVVIDARDQMVTPGFIDVHSHCDLVPFMSGAIRESRIRQGITTELVGQCGLGPAPHNETEQNWRNYLAPILGNGPEDWNWPDFATFMGALNKAEKPNNSAVLVSHGAIRAQVLGLKNVSPSPQELTTMGMLVEEAMAHGAYGISYGLAYLPGMFASKQELVALSSVVAAHKGIMMIHIRSHARQIREAMTEALAIAQESGVKLQISHMRSYANRNFGITAQELIDLVEQTRLAGVDVTFDEHPYQAGSTLLSQILPPWAKEGGSEQIIRRLKDPQLRAQLTEELQENGPDYPGWDNYVGMVGWHNIMISSTFNQQNKWAEGLTVPQFVAKTNGAPPENAADIIDQISELLISENCKCSMVMHHLFAEEDTLALLLHPLCQIGSDGIPTGKPHPRLYGTYPKFLGEYIRDKKLLTWAEGIKRITGDPARRLNLTDRGFIKKDYWADLVIFEPAKISAPENYSSSFDFPTGLNYILVNGQVAVSNGEVQTTKAGMLIDKR